MEGMEIDSVAVGHEEALVVSSNNNYQNADDGFTVSAMDFLFEKLNTHAKSNPQCIHGVEVPKEADLNFLTRDFFPSFPDYCIDCHWDQVVISTEDVFEETKANVIASHHQAAVDVTVSHQGTKELDNPTLDFMPEASTSGNSMNKNSVSQNRTSQGVSDESFVNRLQNLHVAQHQGHFIPPQRPNLPSWPEDTIERRMEGLSTADEGFTSGGPHLSRGSQCPHGHRVRSEIKVDRFSPYDPALYKPLAENCAKCCFAFLKKEMHEIRHGFVMRRNQSDRQTRDHVGPTMYRVRLQYQWIWGVLWKWQKFKEEFRFDLPPEAEAMFEEELKLATEGGTIELPIPFNTRLGRFPGEIMHG